MACNSCGGARAFSTARPAQRYVGSTAPAQSGAPVNGNPSPGYAVATNPNPSPPSSALPVARKTVRRTI